MRSASVLSLLLLLTPALSAEAKLVTKSVSYQDGKETLEGYLAYDDAISGKRPGILVVHAWMGLDEYTKKRADMLAQLGYVAFAADIYGKDVRPKNPDEAGKLAGKFKGDRALLRKRAGLGLTQLLAEKLTDPTKTAAIGYCFGGTTVIELARSGASVNGVVSFHGGLDSPTPKDGKNIKARVLALAGGADPYQKPEDLQAFTKELNEAGVDWQLDLYGGAVHCFTHFLDKGDKAQGCAYDERADHRSWEEMQRFFGELFGKK
ncbi:MAG: dienelactone hydrolase family protein [Myxococcota bacterium]